jgi:SAM-dependent methyltransferase
MPTPTLQTLDELENWHRTDDPWAYETTSDDARRKATLLSELPERGYRRVLDIGCGHGYVTRDLPGEEVVGVDISAEAIRRAQRHANQKLRFVQASIFELDERVERPFDLIVITGVLYPQYVGRAIGLVYRNIDRLLANGGLLISVHIDAWYEARFPLLRLREHFYPYREYIHRLELYAK